MTRARWFIALILGAAALVVGVDALVTYVRGGLVVGVAAVFVLIAILVVGMFSLARARGQLGHELASLGGEVPGGTMLQARQQRLTRLRAAGTAPDLDALADAAAAEEAERGFAGRYLVATTVLVGLIGTFGGLMETLGRLPPLLNAEGSGALALLTGPLAGLAVTFGASVVAILVTLALSLVQGDVTLQQQRVLALLEERTRHVLVPVLWPPTDSAPERAARELAALRSELGAALAAGAEAGAKQIAAVARAEVKRLVDEIGNSWRTSTTAQTEAIKRIADETAAATRKNLDAVAAELRTQLQASVTTTTEQTRALSSTVAEQTKALSSAVTEQTRALSSTLTEQLRTLSSTMTEQAQVVSSTVTEQAKAASSTMTEQAKAASSTVTEQTRALSSTLTEQLRTLSSTLTEELGQVIARLEAGADLLNQLSARTAAEIENAAGAATAQLGQVGDGVGGRLEAAHAALSEAAAALRGAVDGFTPAVGRLAPELSALTQEVALLAARAETQEQPNAVLDELIRLGEDVERLIALAHPRVAEDEERA